MALSETMDDSLISRRRSASKISVNYVENFNGLVLHFDSLPTHSFGDLVGKSARYFHDPVERIFLGRRCWFVDLNETGMKRFKEDRRAAAKYITDGLFYFVM